MAKPLFDDFFHIDLTFSFIFYHFSFSIIFFPKHRLSYCAVYQLDTRIIIKNFIRASFFLILPYIHILASHASESFHKNIMRMLENNKKFYGWLNEHHGQNGVACTNKIQISTLKAPANFIILRYVYVFGMHACLQPKIGSHACHIQPPNRFKQVNVCKTLLSITKKKDPGFHQTNLHTKYGYVWWGCFHALCDGIVTWRLVGKKSIV